MKFVQVAEIVYTSHAAWVEGAVAVYLCRELQVGARPSGGVMPCMQVVGNLKFGKTVQVD